MLSIMITEEEKFKAETFRILGIALLTPAGKILLDPWMFYQEHGLIYTIIYIIFASIGGYFGLLHIEIARGILDKRGMKKWEQQT